MTGRGWVVGRGVLALGLALAGGTGCFLGDDDDCAAPQHKNAPGLIEDCSGSTCETDADCPGDRVCVRHSSSNVVETGIPKGCLLPTTEGDGGNGP